MILTSALVLLAASALQALAPEPTKTSVLPPDCGLTEEQVLDLAIPGYHEKVAKSRAHEGEALNDFQFWARIESAVLSDLGLPNDKLLLATIQSRDGYCDCCLGSEFVVIDRSARKIVWRYTQRPDEADFEPESVRIFRTFPSDKALTLALRGGTSNCGALRQPEETRGVWLRPRFGQGGHPGRLDAFVAAH